MGWDDNLNHLHDLHSAVTQGTNVQRPTVTPYYKAVGALKGENETGGYDQLRESVDDMIAYLVAKKEKLNEAEVKDDPALLKDSSAQLTEFLTNKTMFWKAEAEGDGPVWVPPTVKLPAWPCEGFCASDVIVILVALTGLLFLCAGQKLHKYLICAMGMSIGTFGGLVLCDQMDITEMKPKWCVSLALGLALWIAVMFVEAIMFNALGMFVGGTVAMVLFSVVVEYVPPMPGYYFFIVIGVGVVLGYFLSGYIKALALTVVYSIQGGFLVGSCVSYTFWKNHLSHGDLWLENLTASAAGLDLSCWPILVSLSSMVVFAVAGFFIQNNLVPGGGKADHATDGEKKPLLKDEEKGVVPESAK